MSNFAIRVENLSKQYRIGQREPYKTLRDTLAEAFTAPFRAFRSPNGSKPSNNTFWALQDVSFEVKHGEALGIIGRNGAGKSTLLKILSRITEPTRGRAVLNGRVGSLLEVGTGFNPELTGRENIYLNGAILGMKKAEIERKFDEIVAFAEVEKFIDTPVKRYSSGMHMRLAFAVAAHLEPDILIVDEVLAVGDVAFQKKCLRKMGDISGRGRTVLLVSHNMASIQALCQRVILLQDGRHVLSESPEEGIRYYLDSYETPTVSSLDLSSHPNRTTPSETSIFKNIRLLDSSGNERSTFAMKESVVFEILLDTGDKTLNNPVMALKITKGGVHICSLGTRFMVRDPFVLSGCKTVRCSWSLGELSPGSYSVSRLSLKNSIGGDLLDSLEETLSFEITERDLYGTGKIAPDGLIYPDGEWYL